MIKNNSLSMSKISLLKKKKKQQIISLSNLQKYNENKLYQQFQMDLSKPNKQYVVTPINHDYKNLLAELKNKNLIKRATYHKQQQNYKSIILKSNFQNSSRIRPQTCKISLSKSTICYQNKNSQSRIKYNKIDQQSIDQQKINETSINKQQNQTIKNQSYDQLQKIKQQCMMGSSLKITLSKQIFSLEQSLISLRKQTQLFRLQLNQEIRNQEKFQHIQFLTKDITNQTNTIMAQNGQGLKYMIKRQKITKQNLKKFHALVKSQRIQNQRQFIQDFNHMVQRQQTKRFNQSLNQGFSHFNTTRNKLYQSKSKCKVTFNYKILDQIDFLLKLLKQKQQNYEQIKQQHCTRVRLIKVKTALLNNDRVQSENRINIFENKHQIKVTSIEALLIKIHKRLQKQNQILEQECMQRSRQNQQLKNNFIIIQQASKQIINDQANPLSKMQQKQIQIKLKQIHKNSIHLITIIRTLSSLLQKFRHLFSVTLSLQIQQQSSKQNIIKIDSVFASGLFFTNNSSIHSNSYQSRLDFLNQVEFQSILKCKGVDQNVSKQLVRFLFADKMVQMMLHRTWLQQRLQFISKESFNDLFDVVHSLWIDCQEIYKLKLSTLNNLFINSFKSILATRYQMRIVADNTNKNSIFMPINNRKYLQVVEIQNLSQDDDKQNKLAKCKSPLKLTISDRNVRKQGQLLKDPSKLIFNLCGLKSKSNKLKKLNFSCTGTTYQYNEYITIPNFSLKDAFQ